MASAWIFKKPEDVRKLGEEAAPYYVNWHEPDGRRKAKCCGAGPQGKKIAERLKSKLTAQLMTGTYEMKTNVPWDVFVKEYTERVLDGLEPTTKAEALFALTWFKRHMKFTRVFAINTAVIDDYIGKRRQDRGKKAGSTISPATLNKDLRHLRAALTVAYDWGYLPKVPRFRMERVTKRLPRFVTPEHFAAIYQACDVAKSPAGQPYPAADWWRALLVFAYMTGWRIGDMLQLTRDCVDVDAGYAVTLGELNKGDRDAKVKLHPVVVDHLRRIPSFGASVFPWPNCRNVLDRQFDRIQGAAEIRLPCRDRHQHTDACHVYNFHDLRRAFATLNAPRLTADALQQLMRHKAYQTTQVYINMSRQIDDAVNELHVPEFLKKGSG